MFNMAFTDAQGVTHTNAVVRVRTAYHNSNSQANYQVKGDGAYEASASGGQYMTLSAEYWPDQAKFDAGKQPYQLSDLQGVGSFNFNPSEPQYLGLGHVEACELYLETVLLPNLTQQ